MTTTDQPPSATLNLGESIRILLKRRGMKAFELAERAGVSPTSVSKIINGVTRPRQVTFTRMVEALCQTKEEEQLLVVAFSGTDGVLAEEAALNTPENELVERERIARYMEVKTQEIAFKNAVARELDQAGFPYTRDYVEGQCSCDFLVEAPAGRVAVDTKFNVGRDFGKSVGLAQMLLALPGVDEVRIVVPYLAASTTIAAERTIRLVTASEVAVSLT